MFKRKVMKIATAILVLSMLTACSTVENTDANAVAQTMITQQTMESVSTQSGINGTDTDTTKQTETTVATETEITDELIGVNAMPDIVYTSESTSTEQVDDNTHVSVETQAEIEDVDTTDFIQWLNNIASADYKNSQASINIPAEARKLYLEYLNSQEVLYGITFLDLNVDGVSEMILGINPYGYTEVVSYNGSTIETTTVDTMSDWGSVRDVCIDGEQHLIFNCYAYGHTLGAAGYQEWYIYKCTPESTTPVVAYTYLRAAYAEVVPDNELANLDKYYGEATLNGVSIDEETSNTILTLLQEITKKYSEFNYVPKYDKERDVTDEYTEYISMYLS